MDRDDVPLIGFRRPRDSRERNKVLNYLMGADEIASS